MEHSLPILSNTIRVINFNFLIDKFKSMPKFEGMFRDLLFSMNIDYQQYIFFTVDNKICYARCIDDEFIERNKLLQLDDTTDFVKLLLKIDILNDIFKQNIPIFQYNNCKYMIEYVQIKTYSDVLKNLTPIERINIVKYSCCILYLMRLGYYFPIGMGQFKTEEIEFDTNVIPDEGADWKKITTDLYNDIINNLSLKLSIKLSTNKCINIFDIINWENGKIFVHYIYDILFDIYNYDNVYDISNIEEIFDIYVKHMEQLPNINPQLGYKYIYGSNGRYAPDKPRLPGTSYFDNYTSYVGQPVYLSSKKLFVPIRIPWCHDCPNSYVYLTAETHLLSNIYLFVKRYMGFIYNFYNFAIGYII